MEKPYKCVETLHDPTRTVEDKVQTTNSYSGSENYSGKKISRSYGLEGSIPSSRIYALVAKLVNAAVLNTDWW